MKKPERARCRATCDGRFAGFRRRNSRRADHYLDGLDASGPDSLYSGFGTGVTQRLAFVKDSVNELLEGAPVSLDINALQRHLSREIPEVRNVHHVHVWMVGEKPVMTLHAQVIPPHDHDALLERIQDFLMHEYHIAHATIQMEYQVCHGPDCHLNQTPSGHVHHH
ncbi:zinc transporter ZitB [Salmonella enterica subsp. enterica serovar Choleraesuis str. 0006]|nr:zinc transporter ZitB [Salmonella enterica subsp. enterica serovar Choleraesuis str. 0006]